MDLCIIGVGYVGLVTGAVFADLGNEMVCVDIIDEKIRQLNEGVIPIYEPGLEEMIHRNMKDRRISFTTSLEEGMRRAEIIFICVGTPPKQNGETDLSYVEAAAKGIARHLERYKIIVNKSTVPVGTGDLVREIIERNRRMDVDFDVVSNPEFLREGSAIQDTLSPDRIVIGAPNKRVAMRLLELYASLERPMIITDVHSAEMIKYASNAFLATKISFINAIADICERARANVTDVAKGMGLDRRIGPEFLNAGLGFGGSCFPTDTESPVHTAAANGYEFEILKATVKVNKERCRHFIEVMREKLGPLQDKRIGVLGLAFKPDTDDMREAKSIEIIQELLKEGAEVLAYDPVAMENARRILPDVVYCESSYDVAEGAEALVILTEWREFRLLNMDKIKAAMKRPVIFDGRNIYDPEKKKKMGFEYYSIGRGQC
ncbi:MAG: UDP-glucose/GDP-mannose dehydrogenase family protein [Candidatus Tectomicrobia bacterium]|uniref:UDP-glucose 6-dehydrogenase n=1 Tax=Tectimicrobiota bacterium TaxID=2528274 RepID=A0A932CPS6_UNCTE|nr:UDP-glucose/GDP-mannose dehydrogenase family protein [Candidatus Tectomicrobia bacterium]